MAMSTYGDITPRVGVYAYHEFLKHAKRFQVLGMFGLSMAVPKNKSKTVKFRRPIPYDVSTTPLQEGVTPSPKGIAFEDVEVNLQQYGDLFSLTDVVEDTHEDPVLNTMMELAAQNSAEVFEAVLWGVLKGGTSVFYANGSSRSAVNTEITLNKQRKVTTYLKNQYAKKLTKILGPSVNISTRPVEASYVAFAHTNCESDIRNLAGFVPTAEYGQRQILCEHEIGSVEDVRYILAPHLDGYLDAGGSAGGNYESETGTSANVYPIIYVGADAYGATPLKNAPGPDGKTNMVVQPTVLNPNKADKSDPLGQRGYVAWKGWAAFLRLNEAWMCRLEVAVKAL